ncbi:hypothetical protein Dsin_022906 [Dipteronia sinensis]|uniref:Fe2OG dioxygenase domain-containing protein n=1 Tax=Dipteronia sinensis TaxID=43782 RepID=A0AAE0A3W7_9ROSI|nr:hypothetical protein Dsin_022906 [Dipteronia sinensis]
MQQFQIGYRIVCEESCCLARRIAECLAQNLGVKSSYFQENCVPSSNYVRMNRYPPCPSSSEVYGLMPHTDSDFLTILYQDQVGGLQLMKDGKWHNVKPNPEVLIVNIGHLFQVGFKMFLRITATVTNWDADGTCCNIILEDNPPVDFVELPDTCQGAIIVARLLLVFMVESVGLERLCTLWAVANENS